MLASKKKQLVTVCVRESMTVCYLPRTGMTDSNSEDCSVNRTDMKMQRIKKNTV